MYSRRFVTIAFVIMGVSAVLATASALERAHALERQATDIVSDMLTSIRLLGRLQHELDEQRRLVDEHILSSSPAEMEKLEAGITSLELELDAQRACGRRRIRVVRDAPRREVAVEVEHREDRRIVR